MKRMPTFASWAAGAAISLSILASHAGTASEAIAQAEADLAAAQQASAVWRLLDPATGGAAVPLGNLLKTAKAKHEANEESEAIRIAERISWAAQAGIAQSEAQKSAAPVYF